MSAVDVVVPCYNYARYLPMCVDTVLRQEGVDVRVLIVDDASPDDTPEVGKRLAAADPRVSYVRNEKNLGLMGTANRGMMEWASAEYSLLLSADDALSAGSLARATALMDANPQVGMVWGPAIVFSDDEMIDSEPQAEAPQTMIMSGRGFLEYCCDNSNQVPTPTAVVRTSVQQEVGGYSADFWHTSDFEMWMRFALKADVGVIYAIQGYYRHHTAQMSRAHPAEDLRQSLGAVTKILTVHAAEIDDPESLLDRHHRFCASTALHWAHKYFENGETARVDEFIEFAASHGVPLRELSAWKTLQAKRMIGLRGYRAVTPLIDFMRGKGRAPAPLGGAPAARAPRYYGSMPTK